MTNKRAVIIKRLPRRSVQSYFPRDFDGIERQGNDDVGDVYFSKRAVAVQPRERFEQHSGGLRINLGDVGGSRFRMLRTGFLAVQNPREVEDLLLSLAETE